MKFAQYLNDTQTPEWKKAYIDYRGLKKRITAIRRAQQGQQFHVTDSPNGTGNNTPNAPPGTARASFSSSIHSVARQEQPSTSKHKKGLSIVTNGPQGGFNIPDSPALSRRSVNKGGDAAHSTGVPDVPRRPSLFGRASYSITRSMSMRGALGDTLKPMSLYDLMSHLSPPEIAFFLLLDAQLEKVETFYTHREQEMAARGRSLQEQLQELKEHRRLFLTARAKVPWAASLASAFRPTRKQLKVTRTLSLPEDRARNRSNSVHQRVWDILKTFKTPFRLEGLHRHPSKDSSISEDAPGVSQDMEKFDETHLSAPAVSHAESGLRFADNASGHHSNQHSPISPVFGPDADNYLYAKRKLKKAVSEHYKGLELLHNYRVLNLTGFRKALKKFEKVTKISVQDQYMSEKVEKSAFASDKTLREMMRDMEDMFAAAFVNGNKKKAMKRLRGGSRVKSHHFSTWRSGLLMGLAIPALVSGFFHAFEEDAMEGIPGWEALMMVYAILLIPTLFATLVGLNLLIWARSRINYVFIFELNVATSLDYREYFEIPTILLAGLAYAFWLSFAQVGAPSVSPSIWPLVWLGVVAMVMLNPLPILFRPSRVWLCRMVGRLFMSGTRRVEFTDFWLGDQFCSLVFTFSNLYFFGCVYVDRFSPNWQRCGLQSSYWPVAYTLAVLPFFIRLVQSLKRYWDSQLVTHLVNGGKYGTGLIAFLFYFLWRHDGTQRGGSFFVLYCLSTVIYSVYSLTWDLLMDWSVLQTHSPKILLRPELVYSNHVPLYYCAIVSNVALRFTWLIYLPSRGPDMFLRTFIVALFEMFRRCQWNFYRLENEHLGNIDQYRVTREVPLPYLFDDPHRQDDRDDDDDEDSKNR